MCVDYQPLNKVTVTDNYPAPVLEAYLRRMQKATCYVALDLKSGNNNAVIDPALQKSTGCDVGWHVHL